MQSSFIPGPRVLPDGIEYWAAASGQKFMVPYCNNCDQHHWYPRAHCPFCHSGEIVLRDSPGTGHIYSFSIMRKAEGGDFVIAYIALSEGVTMLANIVTDDPESIRVGQEVGVVFVSSRTGQLVPMFELKPR